MRFRVSRWLLVALIPLCASCGKDKEMLERSQKLEAEIERLDKELGRTKKLLRTDVKDVGKEIDAAGQEIKKLKAEAARIELELVNLRDDKESLEVRFTEYRRKFPIN